MRILHSMVGPSGSGKSTYAEKLAQKLNCPIICPDMIRQELTGDINCQDRNKDVFILAEKRLIQALALNDVIYDATNCNNKNREIVERVSRATGAKVVYYVFKVSLDELKRRQTLRERQVPHHVIEKQYNSFTMPIGEIVNV